MRRLILGLGSLTLASVGLFADPVDFAIPAESTDRALIDFARQAGVQVLFPFDKLQQAASGALQGRFEPEQALGRLLAGTHFSAQKSGHRSFVVTPAAEPPPAPAKRAPALSETPAAPAEISYLDRFEVKGMRESASEVALASHGPIGDLDLPRSQDDALPYAIFSRDELARSGAINLDDFLRREILESDPASLPNQSAGGQPGFLSGSTNLNLRGFGSDETLILLNGLPMPQMLSGGISSGTTTSRDADVSLIPLDLVERVEVLPVSASALYSGNPVGGVINIILRPIEELSEISTAYSNGFGVDAPQSSVSLMQGRTLLGGKLALRFNASFSDTVPPTEQELGYIRANLALHPNINYPPPAEIYPSPIYRATPNIASTSGAPLFGPGSSNVTSVAPGANGSGGLSAFTAREGVPSLGLFQAPGGIADSPDSVNYAYGQRRSTQTYYGSATYDLFPQVQLGVNGLYSHTQTNPGYDVFQGNLTLPAGSPLNPFGQDVLVKLNETAPLLGAGYDEAHTDLYSVLAAVLARLPNDWRLSIDTQVSATTTRYRGIAQVDSNQWQNLVNEGLYNPLRDTQLYGPPAAFYNQALIYFGGPGRSVTLDSAQTIDTAVRVSDPLLRLPTGMGALNFGTDVTINHTADFNDLQTYGDGSQAGTSGLWLGRTLETVSALSEGQAPLLPNSWLPHWIHSVGLDAAARYNVSDMTYGTNVAPTFAVKAEFGGGLSARASISNTNRFPTPSLNHFIPYPGGGGGGSAGAAAGTQIVDPLRGAQVYDVTSSDTPNLAQRPEADVTRSAGIVFQGGTENPFRLAIDFYDTQKSGELDYLNAQDSLTYEAYLPGRVTRAPAAPGDPYGVGQVVSILTGNINLAWRHSQNWTTSLDYAWNHCAGGTLSLYARWAYFQSFLREVVPGSPVIDELNAPDTSGLNLVKNRVNFGAGWSNAHYGFGIDGQYFSPRVLPRLLWPDQGSDHIDSYLPYGAYVKSDLLHLFGRKRERLRLTAQARVDNLFSASLPKFPDNPSGSGVEPYGDWRGQVYSFSVTAGY